MNTTNTWGIFQYNEVTNLIFGLLAAFIVVSILLRGNLISLRMAFAGFFFVLLGTFFTVIEGLFWEETFNFLEHLSYALAGLFFAYSSWKNRRNGLFPNR